jgi:Fe2+ or Zn2+ uptake regulation protein
MRHRANHHDGHMDRTETQTGSPSRHVLEQHGLRCTKQRLAVYETLCACDSHPTAEELYQIVLQREGGLSRATVYNTLNALADTGLVKRLPCERGLFRFDADLSPHVHVRFQDSDEVADLPPHLTDRLMSQCCRDALKAIATELGIELDGVSIELIARRPEQA